MDEQQTAVNPAPEPATGPNPPQYNGESIPKTSDNPAPASEGGVSLGSSAPNQSATQSPVNDGSVVGQMMPETLAKPPKKKIFMVFVGGVLLLLVLAVLVLAIL